MEEYMFKVGDRVRELNPEHSQTTWIVQFDTWNNPIETTDIVAHDGKVLLCDVVPFEFRSYSGERAFKLVNCEVIAQHSMGDDSKPYVRWKGPHKNVRHWWLLADGRAVGWNENESRGWSFPVYGKITR